MGFRSGCERTKSPRSEKPRFPHTAVDFRKQPKKAANISLCVPRQAHVAITERTEARLKLQKKIYIKQVSQSIRNHSQPKFSWHCECPPSHPSLSPGSILLPPLEVPADPSPLLSLKLLSPVNPSSAPLSQATEPVGHISAGQRGTQDWDIARCPLLSPPPSPGAPHPT